MHTMSEMKIAISKEDVLLLLAYLQEGADINALDEDGRTLLMLASLSGKKDIVKLLLNAGANPNQKDGDLEDTALWYASNAGHEDIAELLLKSGADATLENSRSISVLDFATKRRDKRLLNLLKQAEPEIVMINRITSTKKRASTKKHAASVVPSCERNDAHPTSATIKEIFEIYLYYRQPQSPMAEIAEYLTSEHLSRDSFDKLLKELGLKYPSQQNELLDLHLFYIKSCLKDHILTLEEKTSIQNLGILFRIREGDYYNYKRKEITEIISIENAFILSNLVSDMAIALRAVDLQHIFSLSYDQYMELTTKENAKQVAIDEPIVPPLNNLKNIPSHSHAKSHISADRSERLDLSAVKPKATTPPVSGYAAIAVIASYLSIFGYPAPFALLFGFLALIDIKSNPGKRGLGAAIVGIVVGTLGTAIMLWIWNLIGKEAIK